MNCHYKRFLKKSLTEMWFSFVLSIALAEQIAKRMVGTRMKCFHLNQPLIILVHSPGSELFTWHTRQIYAEW